MRESEEGVVLDNRLCNSCKACLALCPFDVLTITYTGEIVKYDLCGGDPEYVKTRPTNAIIYEKIPHKDTWYIRRLSRVADIYGV